MMRAHLLATAATVLMVLLPMNASAQDASGAGYDRGANVSVQQRARPDYDPMGLRFGGFDLNAQVGASVGSNDNVFATPNDEKSDVSTSTDESATLASHWSRHSLAFSAGATQNRYQDNDNNNTDDSYLRAEGRLDVLSHSDIGAGVATAKLHEGRTDPDLDRSDAFSPAEPIAYTRDDAYIYARHAINRVRLTARYEKNKFDYEDATQLVGGGPLDEDFRDYDQTVKTGRVEVALTPRFALLAQGEFNERKYDDGLNRDSNGRTYTVGANFDITDLIRGEIAVGHFDQKYEDLSIGHVSGTAYRAHVDWFPTQLTTVQFNAGRGVEESGTPGAAFLHTYESVRVDHELLRNVILTGTLAGGKYQYQGGGLVARRTDDTVTAEAGAEYLMNRRVRLRIGYGFDRDQSTVAVQNYEVNRVFIGASFHL